MAQQQEDALVNLYKENEIEESNFNNIWLINKGEIEKFIYNKELDIDTLNNYSQNLITYYKNKIKQVNDLKLTRSNDTEKNLEGDATIQILQEENIPKIIEKYGEKYDSSSAAEILTDKYKSLIGQDTTKDVIRADYDERFKVIRYDLLIKEYEKNISDIEIDLVQVIEFNKLMKDEKEKEAAANIIQNSWKKRQKWLYDMQLIPYVSSEVVEPSELINIFIDGCKDTFVDIPADCDGDILKEEIAKKMRADNPKEPCLTKVNEKIEKINKKCPTLHDDSGDLANLFSTLSLDGGHKTRKGGKRTKKDGKKTKKKGNTLKNKQIIIGGTVEKMIDYVKLFDVYNDTLSYRLLLDKLYINLSVLSSKYINSLENSSLLFPNYFDNEIYNIKNNIIDIRSLINSEYSIMRGGVGPDESNGVEEDPDFLVPQTLTFDDRINKLESTLQTVVNYLSAVSAAAERQDISGEKKKSDVDSNDSSDIDSDGKDDSGANGAAEEEKEGVRQETDNRINIVTKHNEEEVKQITESLKEMVNQITQLTNAIVERQKQLDEALKTEETELTDDQNKVLTIDKEIQEENKIIEKYTEELEKINEEEREIKKEEEEESKKISQEDIYALIGTAPTEYELKLIQNKKYASRSMLTQNLMNFLKDCDILNSVPEWRTEISTAVLAFVTGSAENPNNLQRIVLDLSYKYFNLILLGTPGVGKTYTAGIIGKALHNCGFLTVGKKIDIKKPDLIGEYTGQTAPKVYKELTRGLGNVIFIDEAYSIAGAKDENTNKYDSYGQEALDALTDYTSEHIGLLSVIAAGYEYEMNKQFLDVNTGLRRRFPTRLTLPRYELKSFWKILELYLKKFVEQGDTMNNHKACFELQNLMFNYQCNPNPTIKLSKDWKDLSPNTGLKDLTKISIVLTDDQNNDIELSSIENFNNLINSNTDIDSNKVLLFNENLRTKLPDDSENITYTYIKSYIIYRLCSPTLYNGDFYRSQSDNLKKFASSILEYILLQNIETPSNDDIKDFYFELFFRENPNTKIENLKYSIENNELKFNIFANPKNIYLEDNDVESLKDIIDYNEDNINKFILLSKNLTSETQLEYIYISILCRAYQTAKFQSQRKDGPDETDSWWFFDKRGFQIIVDQIGNNLSVIINYFNTVVVTDNGAGTGVVTDNSAVTDNGDVTTTTNNTTTDPVNGTFANESSTSNPTVGGGKKSGFIKNTKKTKRRRKKNKKKNKKITLNMK